MNKQRLKQIYQSLNWVIKLLLIGGAFAFLYDEIFRDKEISEIRKGVKYMIETPLEFGLISIVLLLMPLNWIFEASKWKILVDKLETISLLHSLKAVFSGITVGVFTPNRIGEFGGRVFHLQNSDRIKAVLVTIIGSYAQLITTVCAGLIGLIFYVPMFTEVREYISDIQILILIIFTFSIVIFIIALFLNTYFMGQVFSKIKFLHKYQNYLDVFSSYSVAELSRLLIYSIARYVIFTLQYIFLLWIFGVNISYFEGMIILSVTYFLMTGIPTIAITELGIRGSIAIYLFSNISDNDIGILTASFAVWLINLAIPAIIGTFFVFNLRFFRNS